MFAWMAWTWQTAIFFGLIALALVVLTLLAIFRPGSPLHDGAVILQGTRIASAASLNGI